MYTSQYNQDKRQSLKRIISTNCCIHTVVPPDDGPKYARNMYRLNILRISCASSRFSFTQLYRDARSKKHTIKLCKSVFPDNSNNHSHCIWAANSEVTGEKPIYSTFTLTQMATH